MKRVLKILKLIYRSTGLIIKLRLVLT